MICCLNTKKVERTEISETEMWSNTNHKKKKKNSIHVPWHSEDSFQVPQHISAIYLWGKTLLAKCICDSQEHAFFLNFQHCFCVNLPPVTQIADGASIYSTLISFYYLASEDYRFLINQLIFYQAKYPK